MAEGGEMPSRAGGDLTLPPLGGREPPGFARPGFGFGGQTDGRRSAHSPVRDEPCQGSLDNAGAGFYRNMINFIIKYRFTVIS